MADTKIQLPPDSTGASVDTVDVTTGAGVVKREVVSLGDPTTGANRAAISAAGRVSVDASGVAVPVTGTFFQTPQPVSDNAGSLTVDAPVGTPVFARLSDGAATLIGQKTMAASLPVVVASDQTVIQVADNAGSLTVDAPVGTPAFVRLSDGAAAQVGQKAMAASLPVVVASDQSSLPVTVTPSPLCVVIAPAANTGGTITLPAVAGQFHYITAIEITRNATAALAGTATLAITTTNLPGGGTWYRVGNAMVAGGTQKDVAQQFSSPIKSSVVNTNTTIVFPVPGAAVLWTATVWYYAAA
jgi:hypothetical protein